MFFGVLKADSLGNTLLIAALAVGMIMFGYLAIMALISVFIFAGYLLAIYPTQVAAFAVGFIFCHFSREEFQ